MKMGELNVTRRGWRRSWVGIHAAITPITPTLGPMSAEAGGDQIEQGRGKVGRGLARAALRHHEDQVERHG